MKKLMFICIVVLLNCILCTSIQANHFPSFQKLNPDSLKTNKNDFVAGTLVIFEDQLSGEQIGEFPSKWDLKKGNVETMVMDKDTVIGFHSKGEIFPLMNTETYLPEQFTIEFDCYFHDYGNEGYYIKLAGLKEIRINKEGLKSQSGEYERIKVKNKKGWRRVQLSFNKRALKVYYEGVRLINVPRVSKAPKKVHFSALSHGSSKGKFAMIKNVRIAEGAVPLYNRLLTEGKIVTNDIYFDTNTAWLKPESKKVIQQIVAMMQAHPELKLRIEGHTDSDGSEAANLTLSQQRADAVKMALTYEGVEVNRLITKGLGEQNPVDTNNTTEGKAKNRRVEFILLK